MVFRGKSSSLAQLGLVVAPAFVLFGYNQAGIGGLLSVQDWTETFPAIDTVRKYILIPTMLKSYL